VRLRCELPPALKYQVLVIENAAREAGLDFFEVVFDLLDAKDVNGVAAYGGFPVRYPSWRFGMEYERLEKGRRWGLSKIYELVINNDPTHAYLVRSNSLCEQKLVIAHVYGHADFFKHNLWFTPTDRRMLDTMADHATRLRRIVDQVGQEVVERFLDRSLSVETLIDPYLPLREHAGAVDRRAALPSERARASLDAMLEAPRRPAPPPPAPRSARLPTYDVLGYLAENAPLEAWQREILHVVRAEAYYFAPQRMTKILNEGWASFWHSRLLTGGLLEPSEVLDFADCHSSATVPALGQLNPYRLGIEIFRHAEALGEDVFRLRRVHNDVSLVHKLVDEDFARRHVLPIAPRPEGEASEPTWEGAKAWLLSTLAWGGLPQIELVEADHAGEGALLFVHRSSGRDLDLARARDTLANLQALWRRPVHLLTVVERQGRRLIAKAGDVSVAEAREAEALCGVEPAESGEPRKAG
jgi:stage V sporulation protein R